MLVSIIVPVYNSESFLPECIDSLLSQSYKNIEILLIDDGSLDNSAEICDNYGLKDKRVIVYHKINGGISSARNFGLSHCHGDYVMFCDDDDYYYPNAVEVAVSLIDKHKCDFVKYGVNYINLSSDNKELNNSIQGPSHNMVIDSFDQLIQFYTDIRNDKTLTYVWNGIYKRSVIIENHVKFRDNYKFGGEDFDFNYTLLFYSQKCVFSTKVLYLHYKRNNHSTAAKYDRNQIEALYSNMQRELSCIDSFKIDSSVYKDLVEFIIGKYTVSLISIFSNPKCNESYKYIKQTIIDYSSIPIVKQTLGLSTLLSRTNTINNKNKIVLLLLYLHLYPVIALYIVIKNS